MLKLLVLLLSLNCVFTGKCEVTSEKCKEMFERHSDNVGYCGDNLQIETGRCRSVCRDYTDDKCRCRNCLKENFSGEKNQFLKLYDQILDERFTADEKKSWLPVLSESFEQCKPLLDILNGTDECQFPNNYRPMMTCMSQQNFLNCPQLSFAPSEKCEETRKFLREEETCGTKYEDIFVFDDSIFVQSWIQQNKCNETFREAKLNSRKCVFVPEVAPSIVVYEGCVKQCRSNDCCKTPCILNATSWKDFNEEVVKDKVIEYYKSDCQTFGIGYDIWKPVIESSFEICYPLASSVVGSKRCDIRMKLRSLLLCMRQEMFLNAPTSLIKDPDQFEKIKTFIANETKCGDKIGEKFFMDGLFWDY